MQTTTVLVPLAAPGSEHEAEPMPRAEVDVSVALCTWNGARWVGAFLASLAEQELLPDELVVSDDASTDDTVPLIEEFARTAPFPVRLEVNAERVGSTANFAKVLSRCRGRFIALADQDDLWYPQKLRRLSEELHADATITMVFSDADLIDAATRPIGRTLWDTRMVGRTLRRHPVVPELLFARRPLTTGCTMMVRRRAAEAALPFPQVLDDPVTPMRHDRWLSIVSAAVGTVRALPEPLVRFRVHADQETGVLVGRRLATAIGRAGARIAVDRGPAHSRSLRTRADQLRCAAERAYLLGDFGEAKVLRQVAEGLDLRASVDEPGHGHAKALYRAIRSGTYPLDLLSAGALAADIVRAAGRTISSSATPGAAHGDAMDAAR